MNDNNKKTYFLKKRRALLWALLFVVMLVSGIPMIVFGAIKGITFLLVLGIIFVVLGFYGTPIVFVRYANLRGLQDTLLAIIDDQIYLVKDLCMHCGKKEKNIKNDIATLLRNRCLLGCSIDENHNIVLKNKAKFIGKCPNCNATLIQNKEVIACPYCGYIKERLS